MDTDNNIIDSKLVTEEIDTENEPINDDIEAEIPKESPPPYSEIDPLKKPKERPNSLDIPPDQENRPNENPNPPVIEPENNPENSLQVLEGKQ